MRQKCEGMGFNTMVLLFTSNEFQNKKGDKIVEAVWDLPAK